jgi:hypothetical protein
MNPENSTWAHRAADRLFDAATMAIAYLYLQIVESEDRAALERVRAYDAAATDPQPGR